MSKSLREGKVLYKDKEWDIKEYNDSGELEDATFIITNGDEEKEISINAFINGKATTDDASINSLVKQLKPQDEVEEPEKQERQMPKKSEKDMAKEDAQFDFFSMPMNRKFYDKLDKEKYSNNFSEYEETYYQEFSNLLKDARARKKRRVGDQTISNTYPGDVDELLAWLNDAIVSIDVISGDSTYNSTKDLVDSWNERDNTNYEVQLNNTKHAQEFIITLTSNKDIMARMPEEVKEWKARKNVGRLNQYEDVHVYRDSDNTITSNGIVFDLIDTYRFKLGKREGK